MCWCESGGERNPVTYGGPEIERITIFRVKYYLDLDLSNRRLKE